MLSILLVLLASIIGAFGAIFLKKGSKGFSLNIIDLIKNRSIVTGIILYGLSAIMFVSALRYGELSILYPLVSTTYVWVALFSVRILKERMNQYKWLGIVLIVIGVLTIGIA